MSATTTPGLDEGVEELLEEFAAGSQKRSRHETTHADIQDELDESFVDAVFAVDGALLLETQERDAVFGFGMKKAETSRMSTTTAATHSSNTSGMLSKRKVAAVENFCFNCGEEDHHGLDCPNWSVERLLEPLPKAPRLIVLDLETTGGRKTDGICEIGAVEVVHGRLTGVQFQAYVKPRVSMNRFAVQVHKLDSRFLSTYPPIHIVMADFLRFVNGAPLVAHNASFDERILCQELHAMGADWAAPAPVPQLDGRPIVTRERGPAAAMVHPANATANCDTTRPPGLTSPVLEGSPAPVVTISVPAPSASGTPACPSSGVPSPLYPGSVPPLPRPFGCTLRHFRAHFPGRTGSLDDACRFFKIDISKRSQRHGALVDAQCTAALYLHLIALPPLPSAVEKLCLPPGVLGAAAGAPSSAAAGQGGDAGSQPEARPDEEHGSPSVRTTSAPASSSFSSHRPNQAENVPKTRRRLPPSVTTESSTSKRDKQQQQSLVFTTRATTIPRVDLCLSCGAFGHVVEYCPESVSPSAFDL